jgi:hypothetical protein
LLTASVFVAAAALPAAASAANMFTLDAQADGLGNVALDSSGNVYVAWNHKSSSGAADTPTFCKFALGSTCTSPVSLTLPGPNGPNDNGTVGDFPIVGPGSTVYVVGPRYVDSDAVLWTSTNGGASFGTGVAIANGFDQTGASSVLLDGSNLLTAGINVGLSFDSTPLTGTAGQTFVFNNPGSGGVAGDSLALDTNGNPVEAYWNLSNPAALNYYYYNGTGNIDLQSSWTGPETVGIGQTPSEAGGSGGLYLLSADGSLASNPDDPTAVDVRSYNATSHTFNAPVPLLSNPESGFDEGGGIAETPAGKVVAIWPDQTTGGTDVLDAFISTNAGASFTPSYVATRGASYGGQVSVAATDTSTGVEGVVAFNDSGGLELANLTPILFQAADTVTTDQASGTTTGADISISAGTVGETDRAIVSGANASTATGTMDYALYDNSSCAGTPTFSAASTVSAGVAGAVSVLSPLSPGKYYWRAAYAGNSTNDASASTCGSEVLTVTPATSIGGSGSSDGSTVTITVTCAVTPCTVTVTITIDPPATTASVARVSAEKKKKPKGKTITLGSGIFKIKKKGKHELAVKLSKAGKKYLAAHHGRAKGAKLLVATKVDGHLEKTSRSLSITTHKKK